MSEPLPHAAESRSAREEPPAAPAIPASQAAPTGFAAVLHNRPFLAIWTAQVASQTAQNTLWYTLVIMVGNLTGRSTLGVGVTIVLVQLPTVLFSSVSGVLVDRVSKRLILIGTNVIRVGGVLLYVVFFSHLGLLYLITFLVAVVSQPFAPAEGSTLPLLVRGDQLITANSLFQTTFMASQGIGFALGPVALGLLGIRITLFVLAGLFALAAVVLVTLPPVTAEHKPMDVATARETAVHVSHDLVEAVEFIWRDRSLAIALLQLALAPTLLLVLAEVGPDYLSHNLHIGQISTSLFFLLAPAGAGLAVGLLILGQWGEQLNKERLVLVSLIALGVTVIGLSAVPTIALFWESIRALGAVIPSGVELIVTMVPITFLMGIEVAFINAPVQTIVQQRSTSEVRGRVLAMQQTLTAAMAIPPLILVGGIAAVFGTPATLTLMGLGLISVGLAIVYYS